jgi:hypothetical protein
VNLIAAHKDELKKLVENLSGDAAVSGVTFVASLDDYIARLDTNCSDIGARINEESDSAAERRWENEGGNPGNFDNPVSKNN